MSVFSYRRNGIASLLLKTLIDHLTEFEKKANLKAVYLHVLTTNRAAIMFYEKNE
jgi:N-alpha-acetyltransferase 60